MYSEVFSRRNFLFPEKPYNRSEVIINSAVVSVGNGFSTAYLGVLTLREYEIT